MPVEKKPFWLWLKTIDEREENTKQSEDVVASSFRCAICKGSTNKQSTMNKAVCESCWYYLAAATF